MKVRCCLVDATQGVEAQTIANVYLAIANDLTIIPVINKVDLASADIEGVKATNSRYLRPWTSMTTHYISAKDGRGVPEVLEEV